MLRVLFGLKLLFALLVMAIPALAGPWPRAEGEGFLAFTFDTDIANGTDNFFSFYVEYGLSNDRTLGIERRESSVEIAKTVAFIRWPLTLSDGPVKLAYEMGIGVVENDLALRPAFSVGRGFDTGRLSGWMTLDSRALLFEEFSEAVFETDLTLGLNTSERSKLILQLQSGFPTTGDAYAKVAPSFVYQQKPGRHYIVGVTAGVIEVDDVQVNLGLWQSF